MDALGWIVGSGVAMSLIALSGSLTLLLPEASLRKLLLPLVAFAAGSLLGGAFLHLLPASEGAGMPLIQASTWVLAGFLVFFVLEQLLHWHHHQDHHGGDAGPAPLTILILIGDGLHNFLGGLAIGAAFVGDISVGITAWLAAAAHEVPQEIGDFAVLVHGGWSKKRALLVNWLSGLTFLVGGLVAWLAASRVEVAWLMPFAAGNFNYIGAADLVPEVNRPGTWRGTIIHFVAFAAGLTLMWALTLTE
ncbi:MAG: ZIP family metal transporter [Vicinamibacterales bacterium]